MARPRLIDNDDALRHAMMLFWRNGYGATGIRELEAATGLKASSLYHRYGSKDGLFEAALAHYLDDIIQWRITHYLDSTRDTPDALGGLRRFLETVYDYISPKRPPLACLLVNTALEIGGQQKAVDLLLANGGRRIRDGLQRNLDDMKAEGDLAPPADTTALAELLHLGLQGLVVSSRIEKDRGALDRKVDLILALLPLTHPVQPTHTTGKTRP